MNDRLREQERLYSHTQCRCLYPVLHHDNSTVYRCAECGGWKRLGYLLEEDAVELERECRYWKIIAVVFLVLLITAVIILDQSAQTIQSLAGGGR